MSSLSYQIPVGQRQLFFDDVDMEYLPFIERVDGRTVTYTTGDFIEAFELYYMLRSYGGSVK